MYRKELSLKKSQKSKAEAQVTYRYLLLLRESNIFTYETVYTREYFPQLHESVRRIVVTFLTEKSSLLITKR